MAEEKIIPQFDEAETSNNGDHYTFWSISLGKMLRIKWEKIKIMIAALVEEAVAAINLALIAEWDNTVTYVINQLSTRNNRIWKSKANGNLNHEPPSDPEVTEDTWWIEQSKAEAAAAPDYAPGVFTKTKVMVVDSTIIYRLIVPIIDLPFISTNLATELALGKWEIIGGGGGGSVDIVDDLVTADPAKALSANQGVELKGFIDAINDIFDGAFTAYTAATITINPLKPIKNNYKWTIPSSGPYSITWDFTGIPAGAEGLIKIIKDNSSTARLIPVPTNTELYDDSYTEESEVGFSAKTITGIANNGSGFCRVTTSAAHTLTSGQRVLIASVTGTVEANGKHTVTVITTTTFDIPISFVNAWVSGGTVNLLANYLAIEQVANSINLLHFFETDGKMHAQLIKQVDVF